MLILSWPLQAPFPGRCKPKLLMLSVCLAVTSSLSWLLQMQKLMLSLGLAVARDPFLAVTSPNCSCRAFAWLLQAQTAHVDAFLAVTRFLCWQLHAQTDYVGPSPGCYMPKVLMLILSWLLQIQTAHVEPLHGCYKPKLFMFIHSWLFQIPFLTDATPH